MANIFPTRAKVSPSFTEPDLIVTYTQASGAWAALEGGKPRVKIGSEDMAVYVNSLDLRTEASVGQSPANSLPSATLVGDQASTATYVIRARAIWDHHDMARAAEYNVSLPAAQDLALRQGIFQQLRTGLLYGFTPGNGEGLLNTAGATAVTLPADSYGHTTARTYDNGQMALFLLGQVVTLKTGMFQSGGNIKNDVVMVGPQRLLLMFQLQNIVQVTSYQRPGAGTSTTMDVVKGTLGDNGDTFAWHVDDTLIGKGAGGTDALILTIPEIEVPALDGINTNVFGDLKPSTQAVNLQYVDMPAPRKIPTPTPDGAITEIQEIRATSGWGIRPAGIFIISMTY